MSEEETETNEYERTLLQLPSCHAFKIPARKSAEGYRAADWPKDPVFTGKLRIVAKGKLAVISLIDSEGKVFASCPVADDSAVERCLDSGRYFVIKIQNAMGKHAFVGIAFNERNDAFDFNVALSEHKGENEREEKAATTTDITPTFRDLSLKEGEKIKVKIGTTGSKERKATDVSSGSGSRLLLAPPPSASNSKAKSFLAPPPKDSFSNNINNNNSVDRKNSGQNSSGNTTENNLLDF